MKIAIYEGKGDGEIGQMNRLEVNGELVLTTAQLAKFYGCTTYGIVKIFNNHKGDFIESVHFYKLTGETLKDFKRNVFEGSDIPKCHDVPKRDVPLVSPTANSLTLWTALGAARFAKSLRTKTAWEIYESLALNYFTNLSGTKSELHKLTEKEKIARVDRLTRLAKITKNAETRENLIATAAKIINN